MSSVLSQIINSWPNRKLLNYGYIEQLKDIFPGIVLALFMGVIVYFIGFIKLPLIIILIIQIIVGGIIYIGMSVIFHVESFEYLLKIIKSISRK